MDSSKIKERKYYLANMIIKLMCKIQIHANRLGATTKRSDNFMKFYIKYAFIALIQVMLRGAAK